MRSGRLVWLAKLNLIQTMNSNNPRRISLTQNRWLSDDFAQAFEVSTAHAELAKEEASNLVIVPAELNDRTILVNFEEVTRIDSEAIAFFMEAMLRIMARGGNLALVGVRENVRRFFETARLDQVFPIYSTREEALADPGRVLPL